MLYQVNFFYFTPMFTLNIYNLISPFCYCSLLKQVVHKIFTSLSSKLFKQCMLPATSLSLYIHCFVQVTGQPWHPKPDSAAQYLKAGPNSQHDCTTETEQQADKGPKKARENCSLQANVQQKLHYNGWKDAYDSLFSTINNNNKKKWH